MTDWLSQIDPNWLLPLISLLALLESLAIVGILLPGVAMLAAASWLAGQQGLPIALLLGAGYAGAVLGDSISFLLGRRAKSWLARHRPLNGNPQWLTQGEDFFRRYGGGSLVLGRFIGPLRPLIPLIAGSFGMPLRTFLLFDLGSGLLWAPVYLLPGYWLGQQAQALALGWNIWTQLSAGLLLLLFLFHALHPQLEPRQRLHRLPFPSIHARGAQLLALLSLIGLLPLLLLRLQAALPAWELQLFEQLQQQPAWLQSPLVALTLLGDRACLLPITLLWCAVLYGQRHRSAALYLLLTVAVAVLGNSLLKQLYQWPRPALGQQLYSSFSFPSGHAVTAAMVWASIGVLLSAGLRARIRRLIYSLLLLPILLVPLSRVLLGVHWPLDALAGLLEGLLLAALLRWLTARSGFIRPPGPAWELAAGATLGYALLYVWLRHPSALAFYQGLPG